MNRKNILIVALVSICTIITMVVLPLILSRLNPAAGLAAFVFVAPFAFFPYNQFTSCVLSILFSLIFFFLFRRRIPNLRFSGILLSAVLVVQILVFSYNVPTNLSDWMSVRGLFKARDDKAQQLKVLHSTFAEIMEAKTSSKCEELGHLLEQLTPLFNKADLYYSERNQYLLYTQKSCEKILEGDYAYFSYDQEGIKTTQIVYPFFDTWSQAGWLAIFNIFGYEHCAKQDESLNAYNEGGKPISISRFCAVKQAIVAKDPTYCEQLTRDDVALNFKSCIYQLADLNRQPELCDRLTFENERQRKLCKNQPNRWDWSNDLYRVTAEQYVKRAEQIEVNLPE